MQSMEGNKLRIVFFGSRPLGLHALKILMAMKDVEIVGSIVKMPPRNAWWSDDPYFMAPNILNSHEDLKGIQFDFGVSINYWKIIENSLINKPKLGFINIHHSYNLSYRGRDMTSHAIMNARSGKKWYHGTTLHYTDDGLDTGPIIASQACGISEGDTAWTLFNRVEKVAEELLEEWLPRLVASRAPTAKPEADHPINFRINEENKFIKNIYIDPVRTYDVVRAYEFNNFFEPAHTDIDGKLTYLTISKEMGCKVLVKVDEDRVIYALNMELPHDFLNDR